MAFFFPCYDTLSVHLVSEHVDEYRRDGKDEQAKKAGDALMSSLQQGRVSGWGGGGEHDAGGVSAAASLTPSEPEQASTVATSGPVFGSVSALAGSVRVGNKKSTVC